MNVPVRYCMEFPVGKKKYHITNLGNMIMELPNMMKKRYYDRNSIYYESKEAFLPRDNDVIEYDSNKKDWYIVVNLANYGE
jgi:hypothetical protein